MIHTLWRRLFPPGGDVAVAREPSGFTLDIPPNPPKVERGWRDGQFISPLPHPIHPSHAEGQFTRAEARQAVAVVCAARRHAYLEALYRQSGRQRPGHPQQGLYTGLLADRIRELLEFDQRVVLGDPP